MGRIGFTIAKFLGGTLDVGPRSFRRTGSHEYDQGGERSAEQRDHRSAAAQDAHVKGKWALGFSGIAQPEVRLGYGDRTGHAIGSVLEVT
jgi:hypothetical protein